MLLSLLVIDIVVIVIVIVVVIVIVIGIVIVIVIVQFCHRLNSSDLTIELTVLIITGWRSCH